MKIEIIDDKIILDGVEYIKAPDKLELEDDNFKISSYNWDTIISHDGFTYKINPEGDIIEVVSHLDGKSIGEQLFTWDAAIRETTKVGKKIPTGIQMKKLLKTREDIKNLKYIGYYSFSHKKYSSYKIDTFFWTSTSCSKDKAGVYCVSWNMRESWSCNQYKKFAISVRCLKNN